MDAWIVLEFAARAFLSRRVRWAVDKVALVGWSAMLASDPVGATWGTGVRSAPAVPTWGFNQTTVANLQTPFLMVASAHDKQVAPDRVRELYADVGAKQKVFVDLACSSHNAMWERNHLLLFRAALEWLPEGKASGVSEGMLKIGYCGTAVRIYLAVDVFPEDAAPL